MTYFRENRIILRFQESTREEPFGRTICDLISHRSRPQRKTRVRFISREYFELTHDKNW